MYYHYINENWASTGYGKVGVTDFYRGVWALFYAEYALLPFL